jgi:hypothetical protein
MEYVSLADETRSGMVGHVTQIPMGIEFLAGRLV